MKYLSVGFIFLFLFLFSCKENNQADLLNRKKEAERNEYIFKSLTHNWEFYSTPINTTSEESVKTWVEFQQFLNELGHKPSKTVGAFQKKAAELASKVSMLNNNIPAQFNQPHIKARIGTLITKVKLLDLYIHLHQIQTKKVIVLIKEINIELVSLQRQMDKITEKGKIPVEEGEADMIQMLDTTRAISSQPIPASAPVQTIQTNLAPR